MRRLRRLPPPHDAGRYHQLEDLPYQPPAGPVLNPGAGLVPDWINRYTMSSFPFVIGVTAEQVLPANPLRAYIIVQNKNAASDMFINFGVQASANNSLIIIPRGNYELIGGANGGSFVPSDSLWVLGAVAGMQGIALEGVLPPAPPEDF